MCFSFFGKAFEQAAGSTNCRTIHDAFDTFGKPVCIHGVVRVFIELCERENDLSGKAETCLYYSRLLVSI